MTDFAVSKTLYCHSDKLAQYGIVRKLVIYTSSVIFLPGKAIRKKNYFGSWTVRLNKFVLIKTPQITFVI